MLTKLLPEDLLKNWGYFKPIFFHTFTQAEDTFVAYAIARGAVQVILMHTEEGIPRGLFAVMFGVHGYLPKRVMHFYHVAILEDVTREEMEDAVVWLKGYARELGCGGLSCTSPHPTLQDALEAQGGVFGPPVIELEV